MADDLSTLVMARGPQPGRPLNGLTVLVVEDSRFACEAMRLLCLRSGARIRRADCLRSAHRHLQTYRPTVVIVDLGLPDGSGLDLIRELNGIAPRVPAILATSGEAGMESAALAAGADGYLEKPVESLALFQATVLASMPDRPKRLVTMGTGDLVAPDQMALRDDLAHAAEMLRGAGAGAGDIDYVARFVSSVALSSHDLPLAEAAFGLGRDPAALEKLSGMVQDRLATGAVF